jgi:lipopolysaccharide export system protein LptA
VRGWGGPPAGIARVLRRKSPIALLAACLLLLSPPRGAATISGPADNRPIAITAQSGIEWQKEAQVYVARGNAVATRGTTQVHADTLTAHYRPAKGAEGGNEVYRLDADSHVVISNGADTVTGDKAVYDVGQQIAVVTGKDLKLTTPTDVVTARDSFEWYDTQQLAVARGDAVAVRGDRRIRADVLTAHLTKETPQPEAAKPGTPAPATKPGAPAMAAKPARGGPAPAKQLTAAAATSAGPPAADGQDSRISRIDAQGKVVVSTATDVARGDYGVYDAKTDIATLLGNVTITRGQNVIRGPYAVVDLKTNVSRMMTLVAAPGKPAQPVEGLFVRQDASGAPPGAGASGKAVPAAARKP